MSSWMRWLAGMFSEPSEFSVEEHPVLSRIIKIQRDRYYVNIVSKVKTDDTARLLSKRLNAVFNAVSRKDADAPERFNELCELVLSIFESEDEKTAWIREEFVKAMAFRSAFRELGNALVKPGSVSPFFELEKKYLVKKFL